MRKLVSLLLSLCVMTGCMHSSHDAQLVAADSLLLTAPDSALHCLQQRAVPSREADRMYYYLLLADAGNKCYAALPSDSIMRSVADYYDRHGTPNEQVRAHYLLGCTYRDMGEAPQALDCYHNALDRADTTAADCNHRLLMSVYGQMAEIFHQQNLPQEEHYAIEKTAYFAWLAKDTLNYLHQYEWMIGVYVLLGDTNRILETVKNSQRIFRDYSYPHKAIRENIIPIYYSILRNQLDSATILMHEYEKDSKLFDSDGNIANGREAYYYIKGTYYIKRHQLDSAEYYMRKLLLRGEEVDAYRGLLTVYQQKSNADSIIKYASLFEDAVDTLNNHRRTEAVAQMSAMYNYQRFQQKAQQEERRADRIKYIFTIVLSLGFVIFVVSLSVYHQYRKRKLRELSQLHAIYIQAKAECVRQQEELSLLQSNKNQLQEKKEQEIKQLQETISGYKEKLLASRDVENAQQEQYDELIRTFHQKATGILGRPKPTVKEWRELLRLFKMNTTVEQAVVCREGLLSKMELQVCILLLSEFTNSELCVLLDTTPQRVTNIKVRINKKLFGEQSASTLQPNLKYLSTNV